MFDFLSYTPPDKKSEFELTFGNNGQQTKKSQSTEVLVSLSNRENYNNISKIMHLERNGDIVVRNFALNINSESYEAFIVFADGMVNRNSINQFILTPLMEKNHKIDTNDKLEYLVCSVIPQSQTSCETSLNKIAQSVNFGNAVILIDGCDKGVIVDIKTWEHRSISTPFNEDVVQGPHEGFNEVLRCNTAIVRKSVNNSNLIFETFLFGTQSQNPASLAYIDGIINEELLKEIKRKLSLIKQDYVFSVFDIEKELEENNNISIPQIITTERPDKVCRCLVEGRAALFLNGSPHVLILPTNITDIIASPEDSYLRRPYSVFIKIIRIMAVFLALFTPGIYIALTRFHTETFLVDMMLALVGERGGIPFSSLTEILVMELSFELIKEAGIRIPGSIGSSLGIVGGLVLGQAAVSAGLVSPMVIILVSICGIASFAIPSYSLSFSFRISRFAYIFAGAYLGVLGILAVFIVQLCYLLGVKSFGVPFFVPFSPKTEENALFKMVFMYYFGIPDPVYLKSNRKGDKNVQ